MKAQKHEGVLAKEDKRMSAGCHAAGYTECVTNQTEELAMNFKIEIDREHIENTLSVTYTMGQINIYMDLIRELKELPENHVIDINKTIGRMQDKVQMLLALNPEAQLELDTEREEGLEV